MDQRANRKNFIKREVKIQLLPSELTIGEGTLDSCIPVNRHCLLSIDS